MTEEQAAGGGTEEKSSGSDQPSSQDTVKYETYKKVLSEKKKSSENLTAALAKIEEYEQSFKEKQETELKEQNRWKELYDSVSGENKTLKEQVKTKDVRWESALKIDAFYRALGDKKIDSKYSGFIDTDKILVDPDSGSIDEVSVQREVERIASTYPEIIKSSSSRPLPIQAPAGTHSGGVKSASDLSRSDKMKFIFDNLKGIKS